MRARKVDQKCPFLPIIAKNLVHECARF
jgi:hypothetical protein